MAATPSTMIPLGTHAPDFTLPEPGDTTVSLADFDDRRGLVIMFICNHCPFVKHLLDELAAFGREAQERGLGVVAISSNDVEGYPDDHPDRMRELAAEIGLTFPYLYDESQEVAKAYHAACTPDFFLFDADHRLVYRGQFDGSRPGNEVPVTGADLRRAVDALLAGEPIDPDQKPSLGCNIKWRPGNAPDYS